MIIGCIADDFTGAGDAASFLEKGGLRVILSNGIPDSKSLKEEELERADAVVIALKSRALEAETAVAAVLEAAEWLKAHGAERYYIKYCSTFDSTKDGNIGPVCDAMLQWTGEPYTVLCPSLPINGRTVKDGCLYVKGVPLAESHMRYHPLNPMTDSRIKNLMDAQSRYPSFETGKNYDVEELLRERKEQHFYLIPDYETEKDGEAIAEAFKDRRLFTGGSGLLEALARLYTSGGRAHESHAPENSDEKALILAGSCSKATLDQIAAFRQTGRSSYKIEPDQLLEGKQSLDELKNFIKYTDGTVLIYSSDTTEHIKDYSHSQREISEILEQTLSDLALYAAENGINKLVVAGGETSGAVMLKLGYRIFHIGKSMAPGVPVLLPVNRPKLRIVLKSGNFGGQNFFVEAVSRM